MLCCEAFGTSKPLLGRCGHEMCSATLLTLVALRAEGYYSWSVCVCVCVCVCVSRHVQIFSVTIDATFLKVGE